MKKKRIIIHTWALEDLLQFASIYVYEVKLIRIIDDKNDLLAEVDIEYNDKYDIDGLIDEITERFREPKLVERRYKLDKRVARRVMDRMCEVGLPFDVRVSVPFSYTEDGLDLKAVQVVFESRHPQLVDLVVWEEIRIERK